MIDHSIRELVRAFQAGSRDAFARLVQNYQNLVTSVALARTGDLQRSEDIAQQAFLIAWQKQEELKDPDRFASWLRGIATNIALNERRLKVNTTERQIATTGDPPVEPIAQTETPDQLTSRMEQSELLWSMLDHIPADYREPLILYYREDHSVAAVAELMDLSESAVKQRLKRGRAMLKKEIELSVEKMLDETKPSEAFVAGVLAALPSASSLATVAGKSIGISTIKTGGAKMLATLGTGASLGVLGGTLGSLIGIGGAWLGTRNAVSHATSEDEKRLLWKMFRSALILAIVFAGAIFASAYFLRGPAQLGGMAGVIAVYSGLLVTLIVRFHRQQTRLHEIHGKPAFMKGKGQVKPMSTGILRVNAIASLFGVWAWLIIFSAVTESYIVMGCSIVVFLTHVSWIWLSAPAFQTVADQLKFSGRYCIWGSILQTIVIVIGVVIGSPAFARGWQGVPIWVMSLLVLGIGLSVGFFVLSKARKVEAASAECQRTP